MKETVVRLVCDVGERHDGTTTRTFGVDGDTFEVDLCERHLKEFERDADKWRGHAHKVSRRKTKVRSATTNGVDLSAVRRWAEIKGIKVAPRGNISRDVIAQWEKDGAPTG